MLELGDDVLGASGAPFSLTENRNITEDTRPRAAARRLHRREPVQRENGGNVERHRLHEIEGKAFAIGKPSGTMRAPALPKTMIVMPISFARRNTVWV